MKKKTNKELYESSFDTPVNKDKPTLEELSSYLKRDLKWLEGVADGLNNSKVTAGINSFKHNLKLLLEMIEEVEE